MIVGLIKTSINVEAIGGNSPYLQSVWFWRQLPSPSSKSLGTVLPTKNIFVVSANPLAWNSSFGKFVFMDAYEKFMNYLREGKAVHLGLSIRVLCARGRVFGLKGVPEKIHFDVEHLDIAGHMDISQGAPEVATYTAAFLAAEKHYGLYYGRH